MQCPICKKDLEIKNKKIGENEAGEAIYNEFAIFCITLHLRVM